LQPDSRARVLVTGGTGRLGRLLVPALVAAGVHIRVLARHAPDDQDIPHLTGDLHTGEGVDDAMQDIDTIVHCAGGARGDDLKATHLVRAASQAQISHLVFISVVGADRVPVHSAIDRAAFGYLAAKREAERIIARSGIPWTTLRATQFHDFVFALAEQGARMPLVPVFGGVRFQTVDAREVADRLTELALGPPSGLVPDVAGPEILAMSDMVRDYLQATGRRRWLLPIRMPGRAYAAYRDGANLSPRRSVGRRTWADYLTERTASAAQPAQW
jgi:uncharacterized protein YbjT (DUF2867 family)